MKKLSIFLEINNAAYPVGTIEGNDSGDAVFSYTKDYLDTKGLLPLSISLPLQEEPFSPEITKNYFEGLLPEGFSRRAVANAIKSNENDYLTILEHLGKECLGAVWIDAPDTEMKSGYKKLSLKDVLALAAEGATKSAEVLLKTHLSLTGATGKAGLYYDEKNKNWYLPLGKCASTHIVKQSHVRFSRIVPNEQLCMMTAKKLGLNVPDSFIVNLGNAEDGEILLATRRYDRILPVDSKEMLPQAIRLHQEDFAQALCICASDKYETEKRGYLKKSFELIRSYSSNPVDDQLMLWNYIIFHFLIGDTDGHIKNFSLLYNQNHTGIRLAPAYDILCTGIYNSSPNMSLYYGQEVALKQIRRESFWEAAGEAGLGMKTAMHRFDHMADSFENALRSSADELASCGIPKTKDLCRRILSASGYRNII